MRFAVFILLLGLAGLSDSHATPYVSLIQRALDKQPPLCLGEIRWPLSIAQDDSVWVYAKMAALSDAGLVSSQGIRWSLTDRGNKEFKKHGDFCYGNMRVDKINEITKNHDGTVSVIFNYRIDNLPAWAQHPAMRSAYSSLDNLVAGIKSARYQADFVLNAAGNMKMIGEPYQLDLLY